MGTSHHILFFLDFLHSLVVDFFDQSPNPARPAPILVELDSLLGGAIRLTNFT